ncbi:MAG: hypothetical protein ACR2KB_14930 [Chitinophagaceae bacterium]|nr:hypothetical protein [Flavisolibacter sp.]
MITTQYMTINDEVDLWESWIDKQVIGSQEVNMLYVMGEILADASNGKPLLVKKKIQSTPKELHLEVMPPQFVNKLISEEVFYSEVIDDLDTYNTVVIHNGNQEITYIDEIEILEEL